MFDIEKLINELTLDEKISLYGKKVISVPEFLDLLFIFKGAIASPF